ncbi:hypothetical protein CTAYLR_010433 [Chrysophaeum taylorii]|uniref:EF-hand domain-containing protein n=1 Tax=Chrysophaeum taylorii TaxID=2483200 RepID=A0AAD7XIK7_9STRA|nr:hypothetical protein CTAYLR_010433 [Chrysophaeum taylorii]
MKGGGIKVVVVVLVCGVAAQDPLAGDSSYYSEGPRPMRPPNLSWPPAPRHQWFRGLCYVATGAGVMKLVDVARERRLRRTIEKDISTMRTALDFKRIETQQLSYKVQQLEYQIRDLQQALYESEAEALQRDYDEFKAPDLDDDDVISAAEFKSYIKNYMKAYPQIPEDEYPTFEDFDTNGDGVVTFKEWQHYLQQQHKNAKDASSSSSSSKKKGSSKASKKAMAGLAEQSATSQSFQTLYEKLRSI